MAIETEIKLAQPARSALDAYVGAAGREIHLANVHYDTSDLALARAKSAVRLAPQGWLPQKTFKTVGSAEQGLHMRHEWELPLAGDALEIDPLLTACDVPAAAAVALFRTDFARTLWRIVRDGSTVEAGLDLGENIAEVDGETRRTPIREIELELIDGDEAALQGLAPDDQSKAQRGYRLSAA
ncbi:MAG: CYTH domain-containing protein [Burkholderia sp.]